MAYTPKRFFGPKFLVPLATNPVITFSKPGILKQLMLSNVFSGDLLYNIYLAKAGEDAQEFNKIVPQGNAVAASVTLLDLALVVNAGDKLYATAAVPGGLLLTVSGVEIS